jgi:hypothetical protein
LKNNKLLLKERNETRLRLMQEQWMNADGTLTDKGQNSAEARDLWQQYYDLDKEYIDNQT